MLLCCEWGAMDIIMVASTFPPLAFFAAWKVTSSALRNVSRHLASISSGWTLTLLKNRSKLTRRSSTKAAEKRATACFSGMGGTMAPARSLWSRSYSHRKSE
eukprot:7538713-Ditylum_brightwellii.AAC.1